jgi:hypothetical protein
VYKYGDLTMHTDPIEGAEEEEDPEKMKSKPIPVLLDADGFPELPPTMSNDPYKTKMVQSMLREYCTAHVCELHCNLFIDTDISNLCEEGFITGKKTKFIS